MTAEQKRIKKLRIAFVATYVAIGIFIPFFAEFQAGMAKILGQSIQLIACIDLLVKGFIIPSVCEIEMLNAIMLGYVAVLVGLAIGGFLLVVIVI